MTTGNIYRLPRRIDTTDLIKCLDKLSRSAKRGQLTGIAFIAFVAPDSFIADACGESRVQPEEARRLLPALDARLERLAAKA